MRQQLLDLHIKPRYAYGEWVRHAGAESVHNRLALWLVLGGSLWVRSDEPAGKTHLLHAIAHEHPHIGLVRVLHNSGAHALKRVQGWLGKLGPYAFWMADVQAGPVTHADGIALFHLVERAREMHRPLLIAWRCPDNDLSPPELASRLRAMEDAEMYPPESEEDLRAVLLSVAKTRQWHINEEILDLLYARLPRQLSEFIAALEAMEAASLAERRRISPAWVRSYLKNRQAGEPQAPIPDQGIQ